MKVRSIISNTDAFLFLLFRERAGTVTGVSVNIACLLSVMLLPYMPKVSQTIRDQFNAPHSCINTMLQGSGNFVCVLSSSHRIGNVSMSWKETDQTLADVWTCGMSTKVTLGDTMGCSCQYSSWHVHVWTHVHSLRTMASTLFLGLSKFLSGHSSFQALLPWPVCCIRSSRLLRFLMRFQQVTPTKQCSCECVLTWQSTSFIFNVTVHHTW